MPSINMSLRAEKPRIVRCRPALPPSPAAMLTPGTLRRPSRKSCRSLLLHDELRDDIYCLRRVRKQAQVNLSETDRIWRRSDIDRILRLNSDDQRRLILNAIVQACSFQQLTQSSSSGRAQPHLWFGIPPEFPVGYPPSRVLLPCCSWALIASSRPPGEILNFFTGRFDAGGSAAPAAPSLVLIAAFASRTRTHHRISCKGSCREPPARASEPAFQIAASCIPLHLEFSIPFAPSKEARKAISARAIFQNAARAVRSILQKWRRSETGSR